MCSNIAVYVHIHNSFWGKEILQGIFLYECKNCYMKASSLSFLQYSQWWRPFYYLGHDMAKFELLSLNAADGHPARSIRRGNVSTHQMDEPRYNGTRFTPE